MIAVRIARQIDVEPKEFGNFELVLVDRTFNRVVAVEKNFTKTTTFNYSYYMDMVFIRIDKDKPEGDPDREKVIEMNPMKKVFIELRSKALGDQLAWMPVISEFQRKHNLDLTVNVIMHEFFQPYYPNLKLQWSEDKVQMDAIYVVGYDVTGKDQSLSPVDCRTVSLQDCAAYQLGMKPQMEYKAIYKSTIKKPIIEGKYVVISTCGTAQFKIWNNPTGYQEMTDYFISKGYKVIDIGLVSDHPKGAIDYTGEKSYDELLNILGNSQMYFGSASGLMWLAWSSGTQVCTVNNITARGTEFPHVRVDNKEVCNSCWNDRAFVYDNKNPKYCPRKQDFICSKSITSEMVIQEIEKNNML